MIVNLQEAHKLLKNEQVIAYPTEAVYGLGALPNSETAVQKILTLKQRPVEKGVILIAGEFSQLTQWVSSDILEQFPHIKHSWEETQQANTWLVPYLPDTPSWLTGQHHSIAVRVSRNPTVKALCKKLNSAVVSTSANLAGEEAAKSVDEVRDYFPDLAILEGELSGFESPSTISDAVTQTIIRA